MHQIFTDPHPLFCTAATFSLCISVKHLLLTVEIFDNKTIFSLFCSSQGLPRKLFFPSIISIYWVSSELDSFTLTLATRPLTTLTGIY